jgi:Skp family chaperone for outer membrane proteins
MTVFRYLLVALMLATAAPLAGTAVGASPVHSSLLVAAAGPEAEAMKARHQEEWRALKEKHKAELSAAGLSDADKKAMQERHRSEADAMKARHKEERRALKAS